jgi:hypothetical protein
MTNLRVTGHRIEASEFESESRSILPTPFPHCYQSRYAMTSPYRGGPASIPEQSMWDLWRIKWHRYRFLSQDFGYPLSVSQYQSFILIFILILLS